MAIKSDYNEAKTYRDLKLKQEIEYAMLFDNLKAICLKFLDDSRGQIEDHNFPKGIFKGTYIDQTRKLRESIGAYIFRNGIMVWSNEDGNVGQNRQVIMEYHIVPQGFTVFGIAGMDYASIVESKGYNVISTQGDVFLIDLGSSFAKMGALKISDFANAVRYG
jgi:hypothetical protein